MNSVSIVGRTATSRRVVVLMLLLWAPSAAAQAAPNDSLQPSGWDAHIRLPEAPDLNPDPAIVEIEMEARVAAVELAPGLTVNAWTYNGLIPGPMVRVNVGDRLIVHFSNSLPDPTTVHWHGLRIPIEMDGVPGYSEPPVEPGGTFTYDFIVPDAGIYWYHPHVMSAAQVGFGLYGAFLVEDPPMKTSVSRTTSWYSSAILISPKRACSSRPTLGARRVWRSGEKGTTCS